MIYKNSDGINIVQFGDGDIGISNNMTVPGDGINSLPCVFFAQLETVNGIMDLSYSAYSEDGCDSKNSIHTGFVFSDPKYIDNVIKHLQKAKARFKSNEIK